MWYQLYNFLLDERNTAIIDLNFKKEWDVLINSHIISGEYSKTPLIKESNQPRSVNAKNIVRQASRINASKKEEDCNFF
jgi:hypothetical protein